jgi:glycerate 2-kinase
LYIKDVKFDLEKFQRIKVVGFGKASNEAAAVLEKILGEKITNGAVIDVSVGKGERIKHFVGTHPKPTLKNVEATKRIVDLANGVTKEDLILILVSGGGSSLLCYPESECDQNALLYDRFLKTGATIQELNLVRKHLSTVKGGGLAKLFYPATIVGLIFSDVSGDHDEIVASGATFKDESTVTMAKDILKKYGIDEKEFEFVETPKENKFFERVTNITLVSNNLALEAMKKEAESLGLKANIISAEIYDKARIAINKMVAGLEGYDVALGGGETSLVVDKKGGSGGRNMFLALEAIQHLKPGMSFVALGSDGRDNSDGAGAIVDSDTGEKIKNMDLEINLYLANYDPERLFQKTKHEIIMTGPTGANVSDLMILVKK